MLTFIDWTAVAAVAASTAAVIAALYTWFTFRLVIAQAEPKVVVYACADPDRPTIIMIRVANIGRDVASDGRFVLSRPIPARAYGLDAKSPPTTQVMHDGPLIVWMEVLGPVDAREVTWGQYGGMIASVGKETINRTYTYRHGSRRLAASRAWRLRLSSAGTILRIQPALSSWKSPR